MAISQKAKDITRKIYAWYGSSTGVLFGIPSGHAPAVEAIVQCVLDQVEAEQEIAEE